MTLAILKKGSFEWFNSWIAKISGSKAATAVGWYGKKVMLDYTGINFIVICMVWQLYQMNQSCYVMRSH